MATFNDSNTEKLQELVTCAICLDHYQDPRFLPCSHTFCFNCIKHSIKNGKFNCPFRDNTSINQNDINTLPINRIAKEMVEFMSNGTIATEQPTSIVCDNCSENEATYWCDKCDVNYCEPCSTSVHSMKAFQSHTVIALADKIQSFCTIHSEEKLKYWCNQCETAVCRDCLLFKHKDHSSLPMKDAAMDVKSKFEGIIHDISEIKQNLKTFLKRTKSVTNRHYETSHQQKQDIEDTFTYLECLLHERKDTLLKQLEDQNLETMNILDQHEKLIEEHVNLSMMQEFCVRNMLELNDPIQILKLKTTLSQSYKDFTDQYKKIDEGYTTTSYIFKKDEKDFEDISKKILKFGNINNKILSVKRDGIETKTSVLDLSKITGHSSLITKEKGIARGYKFTLEKPLKLRSIKIQSDHIGQIKSFVVNDAGIIIQNSTVHSDDTTMKWLTIPIECEIQNHYSIFVLPPSDNGSYTYTNGNNQVRLITENCSIESKSIGPVTQMNIGSKMNISNNTRSIDMILDIEE